MRDLVLIILLIIGLVIVASLLRSGGGLGSFLPTTTGGFGGTSIRQGGDTNQPNDNSNTSDNTNNEEVDVDLKDLKGSLKEIENLANSKYKGQVSISNHSNAKQTSPDKERIEIRVNRSAKEKISITGWRLESAITGKGDQIEKGSYLPYSARVNSENAIFLEAGDRVIVVTGRSPIGVSFRLNQCTGYFEQFQDFNPSLPTNCPDPVDNLPNFGTGDLADTCFDFVDRLPRCQVHLNALPGNLGGACLNYINQKINYNTCVDVYKDDSDFYIGEWRIYLERDQQLWRNKREIIKLIDHEGKVVDAITY